MHTFLFLAIRPRGAVVLLRYVGTSGSELLRYEPLDVLDKMWCIGQKRTPALQKSLWPAADACGSHRPGWNI